MHIKINKGFTLIELLVVVSIISMLSSMTFSFLGDARQKGRDTEKIRALIEVRKALQIYATEKGHFPHTKDLLGAEYIAYINPKIIYKGRNSDGSLCSASPCPSYHLAIVLEREDNKVLDSDADKDTTNAGSNSLSGKSTNCTDTNVKDLCYDLVP